MVAVGFSETFVSGLLFHLEGSSESEATVSTRLDAPVDSRFSLQCLTLFRQVLELQESSRHLPLAAVFSSFAR